MLCVRGVGEVEGRRFETEKQYNLIYLYKDLAVLLRTECRQERIEQGKY